MNSTNANINDGTILYPTFSPKVSPARIENLNITDIVEGTDLISDRFLSGGRP